MSYDEFEDIRFRFQAGDQVIYKQGTIDQDTGTVIKYAGYNPNTYDDWLVKWDSDGKELTCLNGNLEHYIEDQYDRCYIAEKCEIDLLLTRLEEVDTLLASEFRNKFF